MVNWEAIGALAEMIGSLAVVVTLAYLALQIRQSNAFSKAESQRFAQQALAGAVLAIAQDGELARIFRNGLTDRPSLSADDMVRFDMLMGNLIGAICAAFTERMTLGHSGREGFFDDSIELHRFLATPGGSTWWGIFKAGFPEPFQRHVEHAILMKKSPAA